MKEIRVSNENKFILLNKIKLNPIKINTLDKKTLKRIIKYCDINKETIKLKKDYNPIFKKKNKKSVGYIFK